MSYSPYTCDNPRWVRGLREAEAYAHRSCGCRPTGNFATIDEAIAAATQPCAVVTVPGAWIVGSVERVS